MYWFVTYAKVDPSMLEVGECLGGIDREGGGNKMGKYSSPGGGGEYSWKKVGCCSIDQGERERERQLPSKYTSLPQ